MAVAGTGPGQAHPHGPRTSALAHVRLRAHACTARRHSASLARWPATANSDESLARGRASLRQPWTGPVSRVQRSALFAAPARARPRPHLHCPPPQRTASTVCCCWHRYPDLSRVPLSVSVSVLTSRALFCQYPNRASAEGALF
jgi:hypothetical protein